MEFLFFIIGFLLGSLGGVTAMCLVQINRIGKEEGPWASGTSRLKCA